MFKREKLTLNIEASEVRLLVSRDQNILRWGTAPLPPATTLNGQIVQPTALGQAAGTLIDELEAPRRKASVSVSGQRSLVRIVSLPGVPARMLDEAVRRAARRELPLPLEELYLSWQVISNGTTPELEVFTLGIPREEIDSCILGLQNAGVQTVSMDVKILALTRAVNLPDVLLANLEQETGSVALIRGFVPLIVRSITQPATESQPPAERANHLATEIQRTLSFFNSSMASRHPPWVPAVCLTGALGSNREIRSQIGGQWQLVEPAPPIQLPKELPLFPYLVNIGLMLKQPSRAR